MKITNNHSANVVSESLINNKHSLDENIEKLATGKKINKASDNASSLAIADKLRTQASSINQSVENASSGIILTQIADKAVNEQSTILDTIKTKLIQAKTATTSDLGRDAISKDISKLVTQIDEIASTTSYNANYLLQKDSKNMNPSSALSFQVGELKTNTIELENDIVQANSIGYEIENLKSLRDGDLTMEFAGELMAVIDEAINKANLYRSDYAMIHNQLEVASRNLSSEFVNLSNAESVIRDTKYSEESANFSKNNIKNQTGSFAMSQAAKVTKDSFSSLIR